MYLTTDESSKRDYRTVVAINDTNANFQLFDYVRIEDIASGDRGDSEIAAQWIGQITAPNINISPVGGPYDPTILYAIKLRQSTPVVRLAETIEAWQITLMGEYRDGALSSLRRRPKPGASVAKLDQDTTLKVLKIPAYKDEQPNAIGYLINADRVPLCVNHTIFTHHILVSGGTGSGKSNTGANLIKQASKQGFFVFLYDAKPDYRKIDQSNSDPAIRSDIWDGFLKYAIKPEGAHNCLHVAIYNGPKQDYENYDLVIGFRASDFEPYVFAELFFDEAANVNQYEEFASVCADLKSGEDGDFESDKTFSLKDVENEITERWKAYIEEEQQANKSAAPGTGRRTIHPKTADAILRKVRRLKKQMRWLDSVGRSIKDRLSDDSVTTSLFESKHAARQECVQSFDSEKLFAKMQEKGARIVHIDCSDQSGFDARTYALFLTRFLFVNQKYQIKHRSQENGIVEFVDEAHRLFTNSTRYKDMLARTFNRTMVEGRSLGHGVILSLQNASQVPPQLLNNMNTHIVMKQNNKDVAKAATQTMGENFAEQSLMLGTGEALCKLFESPAVVLAQMAPSPYELERSDNANR